MTLPPSLRAAAICTPIMFGPPALAEAVDYALVARDGSHVVVARNCAKTEASCIAAVHLIRNPVPGLPAHMPPLAPELRELALRCEPVPDGCFTADSLVIRGWNDRGQR